MLGDNRGMQITVLMVCFAITVFEVRYAQRLRYVNYVTHDDYVLVPCKDEFVSIRFVAETINLYISTGINMYYAHCYRLFLHALRAGL